jgi:hypothetical protein
LRYTFDKIDNPCRSVKFRVQHFPQLHQKYWIDRAPLSSYIQSRPLHKLQSELDRDGNRSLSIGSQPSPLIIENWEPRTENWIQNRLAPMRAINPWITYRTRFLVKAKQLTTSLTFADALGRQHSGRKGDYLVESSDGVLRIAPRQIFEDIYIALLSGETPEQREPLPTPALPPHLIRKSPQPYRDRRNPSPGLRSL